MKTSREILKAQVEIKDGKYNVLKAVNGHGQRVDPKGCTFSPI